MPARAVTVVARCALAVLLAAAPPALAQDWGTGAIEDPENTGGWGTGAIEDPENTGGWGTGSIEDAENSGGWGTGAIEDAENSASSPPVTRTTRARPSYTGAAPRAIFSGTYTLSLAVDTHRDDPYENTLELLNGLEMRVRYNITDRWRAVSEGRLTWDLTSASQLTPFPRSDESGVQGRLRVDLRDFYVAGRAGRWLFRIGNQTIVWGSTDFSRPADQLSPLDLTRGLSADRDAMRLPIPAIDAVAVWDHVEWQFVVLPFFVPHRVAVYGADTSPIRPSGLSLPALPGIGGFVVVDPSLEELAQPLLLQSALPDETPANLSAGTRITLIRRGWDVSLGYLFGWDRTPRARLSAPAAAVLTAMLTSPDDFFAGDALERPDVVALLDSIQAGERPLSLEYDRLHMVEVDGVKYLGPVGVRFEAAFSPKKTTYFSDLRSARRPNLSAALGLSYEGFDGDVVVSTEVFHSRTWARSGDPAGLYRVDGLLGVAGGVKLGLAAFDGIESRFGRALSLELFGVYIASGRDLVAASALGWEVHERLELSVGATLFASWGDEPSIGDVIDRNDAVFMRLERRF